MLNIKLKIFIVKIFIVKYIYYLKNIFILVNMTDITNNINLFIENNAKRTEKLKLFKALDYIKENNIILEYENEYNNIKHSISLIQNNIEIGYFQIDNLYTIPSMYIFIEDQYKGNQLARLMITSILYVLCKCINSDLLLYIEQLTMSCIFPYFSKKNYFV